LAHYAVTARWRHLASNSEKEVTAKMIGQNKKQSSQNIYCPAFQKSLASKNNYHVMTVITVVTIIISSILQQQQQQQQQLQTAVT
jgi:ribosomal protein L5